MEAIGRASVAPAALTAAILRRIRRRKNHALRREGTLAMAYRVPYGVVLPIVLAAAVGALLFFLISR